MTNREIAAITRFQSQNITDAKTLETWIANAQRANAPELLEVVLTEYRKIPRSLKAKQYIKLTTGVQSEYSDISDAEADEFLSALYEELPEVVKVASVSKAGTSLGRQSFGVYNKYISVSTALCSDTIAVRIVRECEESSAYAVLSTSVDGVEDRIIEDYTAERLNETAVDFIELAESMFH